MSETTTIHRLLLTGAAGGLGQVLRERLAPCAAVLRLSDIAPMASAAGPHQEVVPCDLADKAAVDALVQGCDAIVHLGGVSVERPFEQILEGNIKGVFHIYEGARRHGVKRVVFASSNHVIGFYPQSETIDVKHTVVYGMSANRDVWWDNRGAARLGFAAQDSSEVFRAKVEAQPPVAPTDPNSVYQGGAFTAMGPFGD